ncbi:hypothetical protein CFI11_08950 [Thalassococcus sp. S3]|nr:DUF5333 domain-containing protein [Thalassococcus sp. S3]QBF31345.1 hypothetical protein CFI11_08950 [Thalassococcus sp. S3]
MYRIGYGLILAAAVTTAGAAAAKPPLRDVARIDDGLLYVALANEIRKGCDAISPRFGRALSTLRAIQQHALDLGYSQAEIDAYTNSDTEKDRMRARGARYYAANGVDPTKPDDLCALGRAEIARNSAIGVLLRAK